MRRAEIPCQRLIISRKFGQHIQRSYEFLVVVLEPLIFRNLADRMDRRSANLARSFRDVIRHSKNLVAMLVQQQMVIAKMLPAHVPMKILRLHIKRERIREQFPQFAGNLFHTLAPEIGRCLQSFVFPSLRLRSTILCHCLPP